MGFFAAFLRFLGASPMEIVDILPCRCSDGRAGGRTGSFQDSPACCPQFPRWQLKSFRFHQIPPESSKFHQIPSESIRIQEGGNHSRDSRRMGFLGESQDIDGFDLRRDLWDSPKDSPDIIHQKKKKTFYEIKHSRKS